MENNFKPEELSKFTIIPLLTSKIHMLECDTGKPNFELEIEHVYGYRANDCTNNLHYTDKGDAVFMSAAMGIVMDTATKK